ncbi:hypothetical protein ABW19_dt0207816 [Dactylella cylindrospora]|nr:hypothetical protein ABW19_dt0207816 [Dactylella cylindrospora]
MATEPTPGGRPVVLTLPCNPPSTTSSVYAASEVSTDTATSIPSLATNSTFGDIWQDSGSQASQPSSGYAHVPRGPTNNLSSNTLANIPLPLLLIENGDTLLFLTPPPSAISPEVASVRPGSENPPLRVLSSRLLSTGSAVFKQLLEPRSQQRILNRLVKQKKIILADGRLPSGISFVLDITPEDEGEGAVMWQEKLWCPDVVLSWKSTLVALEPLPPLGSQEEIDKKLDEFRQQQWGSKPTPDGSPASPTKPIVTPKKPVLPDPYTFGRHVINLERLIHILHGIDPIVQSTVDWYTLHCLSVAFGTTDLTRDYIAKWIFANSLIIETHPSFIWKVAVEAGLANIASDAFAAAVMRYTFDDAEAGQIPGAIEAAISLSSRAQKELKDLLTADWVEQYLPSNPSQESEPTQEFETFKYFLRNYVKRMMVLNSGIQGIDIDELQVQSMMRAIWVALNTTALCQENVPQAPENLDATARYDLQKAIDSWNRWETMTAGGDETDDLWKDVKLGVPHYPIASITQETSTHDAKSEIVSDAHTEVIYNFSDDDVQSVSSTHTLNQAMHGLKTEPMDQDQNQLDVYPFTAPKGSGSEEIKLEEPSTTIKTEDPDNPMGIKEQANGSIGKLDMGDQDTLHSLDHGDSKSALSADSEDSRTVKDSGDDDDDPSYPTSDPYVPSWLREQVATLSRENRPAHFWAVMHHPNGDTLKPSEPRIRCLDCPDMLYFPGPGETLNNFRIHLRNIRHMNRVEARRISERGDMQFQNSRTAQPTTNDYISLENGSWWKYPNPTPPKVPILSIPLGLTTVLRLCETYISTKCKDMTARNIVFEPILLEEQIACLEEAERKYMPLWSGGEAVSTNGRPGHGTPNRGVADGAPGDDMTVNVSTTGVGSVATASTFSSVDSFSSVEIPVGSVSGDSVASLPEEITYEDVQMSQAAEDDDDWDMGEEDDSFEDDDDDDDDDVFFG